MSIAAKPIKEARNASDYQLRYDAVTPEASGLPGAITSFNARLENTIEGQIGLAGLSGVLIDTGMAEPGPLCVTIHNSLKRHAPPRRISVMIGAEAEHDIAGGVDGRMQVSTRRALFLWLPEIYDEGERGGGTRLLRALQHLLASSDGITVLIDFGVEDEQDGFIKIFYPHLRRLGLRLSATGQFAEGVWSESKGMPSARTIGIVYL